MSNTQAIFSVPVFVSSRWSKTQIQKIYDPGKYLSYDDQYMNTCMYIYKFVIFISYHRWIFCLKM